VKPTSRANSDHYTWGQSCDGWHLVKDSTLSVIQEKMPPATAEARHYHQNAQQFFFILSGEAVMAVETEQITLRTGEGLHIPPGIPHQIQNLSDHPVEFLVISQPPSHGDRMTL
jgi:mannose-6-phosphate isomerase-like protein (cupin superfamily)